MSTTMEDIYRDEMLETIHYEIVMEKAALEQCIYIFVEGESEEQTFQDLLEDSACGLNFKKHGVVIANYNGIGNLQHAVRLLRKTLSHDRPVVVTFDNDMEGKRKIKYLDDSLFTAFEIPQDPVVKYQNGNWGGSFEESFTPECFLSACSRKGVLPPAFSGSISDFSSMFIQTEPWFPQLAKFVNENGYNAGKINKIELAKNMANSCYPIPRTYIELAKIVLQLREKNPIKHPDDIEIKI